LVPFLHHNDVLVWASCHDVIEQPQSRVSLAFCKSHLQGRLRKAGMENMAFFQFIKYPCSSRCHRHNSRYNLPPLGLGEFGGFLQASNISALGCVIRHFGYTRIGIGCRECKRGRSDLGWAGLGWPETSCLWEGSASPLRPRLFGRRRLDDSPCRRSKLGRTIRGLGEWLRGSFTTPPSCFAGRSARHQHRFRLGS
jgi:hypothetical protein